MDTIVARDLTKWYGKQKAIAVDHVSFSVRQGELFGLIGPDGAGKTSIFRMLTTLLLPDIGGGSVAGFDIVRDYKSIRQIVGYMPGRFSLYQDLSVEENLRFFATLFKTTIEANYDMIRDIYSQIEPFKKRRAGKLSGGMKQKLALSCALIHKPEVLFLDEPTTGVDPVSRTEFWDILRRLKEKGMTILVSTPYMDEANRCDRIALMQGGKILSVDTPQGITSAFPRQIYAVRADAMASLLRALSVFPADGAFAYAFGEYAHLSVPRDTVRSEAIEAFLQSYGLTGISVMETGATIEDAFINLLRS